MAEVSVRDLRNRSADVLDRVARGESLIACCRNLPKLDPEALRADLDAVLDSTL